ncbi:hypothetical protein AB0C51_01775 [Streptomyces pathocidini]|uniref:Uncharacterized protein n=1 Tax=Streptomyces pathocidini TaxID=1650571 RepID=A0ABW7UXY0_9ACTN|nr:hypothetical protein [Streptomyces pathocidini]
MSPALKTTIRLRTRAQLRRLSWALRHPLRLLQRYGFGAFQIAVLVVPVALILWICLD